MSISINIKESRLYRSNALFLLRNSLNGLNLAVDNLINPIARISEAARSHLTFKQIVAVENAFSLRTANLRNLLNQMRIELAQPEIKIFKDLDGIRMRLESLRNEYLKSEMAFGLYVDLLHTRAIESAMGKVLKGYDKLAIITLRHFLSSLGYEIPTVIVYLEQIGDGAAILRADISLWDRMRNPCAVIKLPQSTLNMPRSSIIHEAGHQIGSITGLNREITGMIYSIVRNVGGSHMLSQYYRYCATEIVADQIANQMTNWISAITLYNIYSGGSGSSLGPAARMFGIIPLDTHLNGYLRIRCSIESAKFALGTHGPWTDFERTLEILYPISLASGRSAQIINESLPLLPSICKALATTKLTSLGGKSFEQIYPMQKGSPNAIKKLLNMDITNFSVDMRTLVDNPILTLVAFGTLQMMGGKTLHWISNGMRNWLISLGGTVIE